jgi:hypothetical protein
MNSLLTRNKQAEAIRTLNDAFRRTFSGGKVMTTASVAELPDMVKAAALQMTAAFDDFDSGNDPYQEHDFGSFVLCGRSFIWKIDYYDENLIGGSEDPTDPAKTTRVLTLMLQGDY